MSDKPLSHLIGGFAGGLTSAVILQPFDLVKTRLQQQQSGSIRDTIRSLSSYKELWRGTLPSAVRTSVGSALYLTSLHGFRSLLASDKVAMHKAPSSSSLPKLSMAENLVTGAVSRGFVGFITMPITIVKVRYESTLYRYDSVRGALQSIHETEGIKGFFRGFTATCMRDAPYAGLYVLFYEQCKVLIPKALPQDSIDGRLSITSAALINSASAFSAASIATAMTGPFDTIKTRMQLQPAKFNHFLEAGATIIREEGARRLFDGLSLRLTRKAFSAGIAWGIYEEIIKFVVNK